MHTAAVAIKSLFAMNANLQTHWGADNRNQLLTEEFVPYHEKNLRRPQGHPKVTLHNHFKSRTAPSFLLSPQIKNAHCGYPNITYMHDMHQTNKGHPHDTHTATVRPTYGRRVTVLRHGYGVYN